MKLYRAKVPAIAKAVVERLVTEGDIEVRPDAREEAEKDLSAIMDEYLRRDNELREQIRDEMSAMNIPYSEYGRTRKRIAEELGHPLGDDVERFLCRQFIENLLISPSIDEVFEEDRVLYKKVMEVLKAHDVDEAEIRDEAVSRIKNVQEGTVDYEIALQEQIKQVKKRRGLIH
ncbi:MAG: DUF507 family protein [Alphaproteobacteria bacterium]|nr:DUF507 family protein [Alphaproteobacteria bacterium]MCB9695460.1 DUF507 family protein [Alphaproteobacteria bacterium]